MTKTPWKRRKGLALGTLLAVGLGPAVLQGQELGPALGTRAPDATLQDLDGNVVQILDYVEAGKPTLIEFWATWCGVCRALQPQMDQVHRELGSRVNLVAVAVAVSQTPGRVKRHVEEHGVQYPYLWDEGGEAVKTYNIPGTGIVVILDGTGRVAYVGTGPQQDLVAEMEKLITSKD